MTSSSDNCPRCDRPLATDEQWREHASGCECATCCAACWARYETCCSGEPVDWRARALTAEGQVERLTKERYEALAGETSANEAVSELLDAVERLTRERDEARKALSEIREVMDCVVGTQSVNWSAHVYPIIASLSRAGYDGAGYEEARDMARTLIAERDEARAVARTLAESTSDDLCGVMCSWCSQELSGCTCATDEFEPLGRAMRVAYRYPTKEST